MRSLLSPFQLTEVSLGSIYFLVAYIIFYMMAYGEFDVKNIMITWVLFTIWIILSRVLTNYFLFNNNIQ